MNCRHQKTAAMPQRYSAILKTKIRGFQKREFTSILGFLNKLAVNFYKHFPRRASVQIYILLTHQAAPAKPNIWIKTRIISLSPGAWMFAVDQTSRPCPKPHVFTRQLPFIRHNLKEKPQRRRLQSILSVVLQGSGKLNDVPNVTELPGGTAGLRSLCLLSLLFPFHCTNSLRNTTYVADSAAQTKWPVLQHPQPGQVYKRKKKWV